MCVELFLLETNQGKTIILHGLNSVSLALNFVLVYRAIAHKQHNTSSTNHQKGEHNNDMALRCRI